MNREVDNSLKEYYRQPHWKSFSKSLTGDIECECELCHTKHWKITKKGKKIENRRFVVHHKHYNSLGHEKREDVMLLCSACHNLAHEILRRKSDNVFMCTLQEAVRKFFEFERRS